jgi:hypothetical protein
MSNDVEWHSVTHIATIPVVRLNDPDTEELMNDNNNPSVGSPPNKIGGDFISDWLTGP